MTILLPHVDTCEFSHINLFHKIQYFNTSYSFRGVAEGKDTHDNLFGVLIPVNESIRQHVSTGDATLIFVGGGDGMWIQSCIGLQQGYSGNYACCPYCLVPGQAIHETSPFAKRTLHMAYRCAHMFHPSAPTTPFVCDGCNVTFSTQAEIDATKPRTDSAMGKFKRTHFGWTFGTAPCLDIDPQYLFVCTLHLKLNIGKLLFKYIISETMSAKDATNLVPVLKSLDINVTPPGAVTTDARMSVKSARLNGREVNSFLENVDSLLDVLHSSTSHRQLSLQAVDYFIMVYNTLTDPERMTSKERVERVREEGKRFHDHMTSWLKDDGVTYYVHHLLHHIPDQIALLPDDFPFHLTSGSALEAQNGITKRVVRRHCNNNRVSRTSQVLRHLATSQMLHAPSPDDLYTPHAIQRAKRNHYLVRSKDLKAGKALCRRKRVDE
jgi:hypothetical protein